MKRYCGEMVDGIVLSSASTQSGCQVLFLGNYATLVRNVCFFSKSWLEIQMEINNII